MSENAPAFSFYAKDFMLGTVTMSLAERGAYITLLAYQWDCGSVPADHTELARICGCPLRQLEQLWATVRVKFQRGSDGLFRNARLEAERAKQLAFRELQSRKGQVGARARWKPGDSRPMAGAIAEPIAGAMAGARPMAATVRPIPKHGFPSPSPSPSSGSLDPSPDVQPPPVLTSPGAAADARSKRPIFKGERFVVFEWQLDDLRKMLGTHFDAFDIHSWFYDLEKRATQEGLVIPPRDGGAWLAAQTLVEAQKRGLPIATTPAPNTLHQSMFGPGTSSAELAAGAKRVLAERGK